MNEVWESTWKILLVAQLYLLPLYFWLAIKIRPSLKSKLINPLSKSNE